MSSDLTIEERVAALEQRDITLGDLPLAALQRRLEQRWQPDSAILLEPASVTSSLLATDVRPRVGVVSGAGAKTMGTGFTVSRTAAGTYAITFSPAFASRPAVVATQEESATHGTIRVHTVSATSCTVITTDGAGANTDRAFAFIASI